MDWLGANEIDGFMRYRELEWLYKMSLKMESIVEVGCWMGRSTYAFCSGCKGTVYAVDHFLGSEEHKDLIEAGAKPYDRFIENTKKFSNLEVLKMSSEEASHSPIIPPKVDMVFIDGDHSHAGVLADIKLWYPRTKKIICGHDWGRAGITPAVEEYFDKSRIKVALRVIWMVEI